METSCKGIWIPEELWQNEELTVMEKLFVIKINALDGEEGCYASNKYFSEYFKLSRSRCSVIIKSLKDKGYIFIKYSYEKGKNLIERRVIKIKISLVKIVKEITEKVDKTKKVLRTENEEKEIECLELSQTGEGYESEELEKLESENRCFETIEDRSSHNKLKVKNREEKKNSKKHFYEEIIGYLNAKCNKNYKCTTGKTQRCINARLREGNSLDDFKKVIDKKYEEWSKTSMKIYLRPETLFGGKFERYLTEETKELSNNLNNSKWKGGQAYGKQFENVRNSGENKKDEERTRFGNFTPLTDEEREWAERELF